MNYESITDLILAYLSGLIRYMWEKIKLATLALAIVVLIWLLLR